MAYSNGSRCRGRKFGYRSLLLAVLLLAITPAVPADDTKSATIDATAMGTSTQMGKMISVKVIIDQFSTQEDRQVLVDAFKKGQSQGLVDALTKAKPVGRIAITGTVGTDLTYIGLIRTPTGRRIRFATNRPIRIGEAMNAGPSTAYNLTAGEFDLNDADKNKSTGVLYPAAQLIINKKGELQWELRKNPWKLVNIIDWNKAGSEAQPLN
jgi:hypothetical protein